MTVVDLMALAKQASRRYGRERWYKLDLIAQTNLGRSKTGDGKAAAEWLASGDPALRERAAAYCRQDVQLCVDLFALAQTDGLLLPARSERGEAGDLRMWLNADGTIRDVQRVG